ncbi:MTC6 [[Candida] subhashii]|uniref:Maintenance of telomere capping protein 6 n=1 Tax=[Candida] subhashii TaxID=561895 RepID=A0A8J5QDZ1_9ASCO|nr:MTC6 [[Candida] subhashii]KAG7663081.1 MTC6 [[Candida] subhashii]
MKLLIYLYICWANLSLVSSFVNWPTLSSQIEVAIRSQRDVSRPIPIDQLSNPGLSLSSMLFEQYGYSRNTLTNLETLLQVGSQGLLIDLYWNEFTSKWQLCPAPFPTNTTVNQSVSEISISWNNRTYICDPQLTTENIMNYTNNYIQSTNTNLEVNLLQMLFNLKSISIQPSSKTDALIEAFTPMDPAFTAIGNSSLNETVASLGSSLFTPIDLDNYRANINHSSTPVSYYNSSNLLMPSLETVLLTDFRRILVNVVSNELEPSSRKYNITQADRNVIFFNDTMPTSISNTTDETVGESCESLIQGYSTPSTHFRYIMDNTDDPFTLTSIRQYIRCGLSPIFNSSIYQINNQTTSELAEVFDTFIPYVFWSWSPGEPRSAENATNIVNDNTTTTTVSIASASTDIITDSSDHATAFRCTILTSEGWAVADCYEKYTYACQNSTSPHSWAISTDEKSYFDIESQTCPPGYSFGVPRSNGEMLALMNTEDIEYPVWIDLNDLTVEGCFVSGGPYAECPYQRVVTTDKFVRMIAPSFVVAAAILILIFMEKFIREMPVQTNRKRYWRKVLQEYYEKNDYEGVPS